MPKSPSSTVHRAGRLSQVVCTVFKGYNVDSPRISQPRELRHLRRELIHSNRFPPILQSSDPVKRQNSPAAGPYPFADIFVLSNSATVYTEPVREILMGVIR